MRMLWLTGPLLILGCASTGTVSAPTARDAQPADLGMTVPHAIEVCMPQGQREYLARLVCTGGEHPRFRRIGSVGLRSDGADGASAEADDAAMAQMLARGGLRPGETDHHMVDGYEVACPDRTTTLYLDMYHCDAPRLRTAPAGFTITD